MVIMTILWKLEQNIVTKLLSNNLFFPNFLLQVIQEKGEGIVLLPNAAHSGGNLGPNLAEACNFGTNNWIPYGCVSLNCPCM